LHRTKIGPVYVTGEENGTHFYAMELIDGPSLDKVSQQLREASRGRQPPEVPAGSDTPGSPGEVTGPYLEGAGASTASQPGMSSSSLSSDGHHFDTVAGMVAFPRRACDPCLNEACLRHELGVAGAHGPGPRLASLDSGQALRAPRGPATVRS
jgi:hypothetical protein